MCHGAGLSKETHHDSLKPPYAAACCLEGKNENFNFFFAIFRCYFFSVLYCKPFACLDSNNLFSAISSTRGSSFCHARSGPYLGS